MDHTKNQKLLNVHLDSTSGFYKINGSTTFSRRRRSLPLNSNKTFGKISDWPISKSETNIRSSMSNKTANSAIRKPQQVEVLTSSSSNSGSRSSSAMDPSTDNQQQNNIETSFCRTRKVSDDENFSRRRPSQSPISQTPVTEISSRGFADNEHIRVPIVGYEIMEERARFTVFKLRIENPFTNDCWLVLRRYTDFVRLNNKIKTMLPNNLTLPRKKLLGNNFSNIFLETRVKGLQMYINTIMANDTLKNLQIVRDFFCLDEPPTYSDSVEECRAIFEAQEETIAHLKLQLKDKDDTIEMLKENLAKTIQDKNKLQNAISKITESCTKCSIDIDDCLHRKS